MTFLNGQTKVCLILDYFMPDYYKQHIVSVFDSYGIGVITQTFKSLKYKALEGKYVSNNPSNKIIVLSYQGHYVGRPYNHYPNSFDPICLCEKQELLNIINPFVFDPYYAVHHYEYMRTLRNILSSDYRMNYVKCTVPLPERPKRKIDDSRDRSTSRSSNSHRANQNNKRYSAFTGSGKSIKLIESDYVICKENNLFSNEQIIPVSSLNSLMQESEQAFLICPLSKLQDILESILEQSEDEIKKDELYIRQDERYALTDDEVSSESELWEILLRRKVELRGADIVFAEVMEKIPYSEQIKRQSFERWYAQNNDMILPRSRRMQDALFQYLSIATPYDKIIRRKKAQKGTKTEQKNSMLRSFLCNNLFSDDYKQAFERLSDGMKDMFGIDNHDDLEALIDLLKKEIDYTEIKIYLYMIRTKRESLELFIKEQLIGPGGCKGLYSLKSGSSVSEETDFSGEVVSTTPGSIYSSAILFPFKKEIKTGDASKQVNTDTESEAIETPDENYEQENELEEIIDNFQNEDEDLNSLSRRFPSSMGISCCLDSSFANDNELKIVVSGRYYTKLEQHTQLEVIIEEQEAFEAFLGRMLPCLMNGLS